MSADQHHYRVTVTWTGNRGSGTSGYSDFDRDHIISADGKPDIAGSSDPAFRGHAARWNPEDLLVASLSACHKLWYLHLCAVNGIVIEDYVDHAEGIMETPKHGPGKFVEVILKPHIVMSAGDPKLAEALHHDAHEKCFIANSVNFPIGCEAAMTFR